MGSFRQEQRAWNQTDATRPAMKGKITEIVGGRYNIERADGRIIRGVGGFGNLTFAVGQCVTFNFRKSQYMILQPAPAAF